MELPKVKDKMAVKVMKKKVNSHTYAKRKQEEMSNILTTIRKVAARKD